MQDRLSLLFIIFTQFFADKMKIQKINHRKSDHHLIIIILSGFLKTYKQLQKLCFKLFLWIYWSKSGNDIQLENWTSFQISTEKRR